MSFFVFKSTRLHFVGLKNEMTHVIADNSHDFNSAILHSFSASGNKYLVEQEITKDRDLNCRIEDEGGVPSVQLKSSVVVGYLYGWYHAPVATIYLCYHQGRSCTGFYLTPFSVLPVGFHFQQSVTVTLIVNFYFSADHP